MKIKGDKIVGATWRCVLQVLGQRAFRWSLLGDYDISVKHTVTTLIADDAILERAIKQGLSPSFFESHNIMSTRRQHETK